MLLVTVDATVTKIIVFSLGLKFSFSLQSVRNESLRMWLLWFAAVQMQVSFMGIMSF